MMGPSTTLAAALAATEAMDPSRPRVSDGGPAGSSKTEAQRRAAKKKRREVRRSKRKNRRGKKKK